MIRRVERDSGARFEVYAQRDRKKKYVGSYGTKREAQDADEDFKAQTRAIGRGELAPESNVSRTFAEAADEWIESLRKAKRRTADSYAKRVQIYLKPTLGTVVISRVTASHVMALRDEQAGRFAPTTVNGTMTALSSAFTYFRKRQWVTVNPCHGVEHVEVPGRDYTWIRTRASAAT